MSNTNINININIDGTEYPIAALSDEAKNQLMSMRGFAPIPSKSALRSLYNQLAEV